MIKINLRYDETKGCADKIAQRKALEHIEYAKSQFGKVAELSFTFGNIIYLNEWRIAVRSESFEVIAVYAMASQVFDRNGRSEMWPEEMSILDHQLEKLLLPSIS